MKIAVSATGPQVDAQADERFGRCAYFLVFDQQGNLLEAVKNGAAGASGGAGVRAAQTLINKGVKVLLTGRVGPKAMPALKAGDIAVYVGNLGTAAETVQNYKKGLMQPLSDANSQRHAGLGQ